MKKRVIWIVCTIILVILASFAYAENWGCCIDSVSGCYNVFTQDEIESCQENYEFDLNVSCYEIPTNPSVPVTDNAVCQQIGCCCFDDGTYSGGVVADTCNSYGGDFAAGEDCGIVCGNSAGGEVSCNDLNGYWCLESDVSDSASELTGVSDFTYRPSSEYLCYDKPCTESSCDYGPESYEKYCANGRNDDSDCLVDNLDTDCQNSVRGYVVDENMIGVSNVKVKIENTENGEIFYTYSVGYDGEYYFQGLSYGNSYLVTVDDPYYDILESPNTFRISPTNTFADNKNLVVIPGNARGIEGFVRDKNNNPIEGALVILDNTDHYAITDSSGEFFMEYIRTGDIYSAVAYKSGYFPSEKNQFRLNEGNDNYFLRIYLENEGCDISAPIPLLKNATVKSGKAEIKLEFEETGCDPTGALIYRCDKQINPSCNNQTDFISLDYIEGFQGTYTDSEVEWGSSYVYKVAGYYENGKVSDPSNSVEVFTGDSECSNRPIENEFCIYEFEYIDDFKNLLSSTGYKCDDQNLLSVVRTCNEGTKCIEFDVDESRSETTCRAIEDCEPSEDNLLGLFYDESTCEGRNNDNFCAYDYSRTNVDYCFNCDSYTSCFDYRSENTCGEDICGIGGCSWTYTDTRLNQGVCYSEDKSSCYDCNSPFNKVFGVCDEEVCSNLGDCSYSSLTNQCEDCDDVSCYDYTSSDFCGSATSINLNTRDNSIIKGSGDTCEQGVCLWSSSSQMCYKDSDADGIDDCSDLTEGILSSPSYTEEECMVDTISPETSIHFNRRFFNPETGSDLEITFKPSDRVPGTDVIYDVMDVYFCIEGEGTSTCRSTKNNYNRVLLAGINYTLSLDEIKASFGNGENTYRIRSGKNIIKYFSKDFSSNLELVKEDFFYLDTEAPDVELSFATTANGATKTTDVYVVGESNEDIYCYAELSDCEVWGNCAENAFDSVTSEFINLKKREFGPHFGTNLYGLQDGASDIIVKCTDFAGNIFEETHSLMLDSDSRIVEPKPSGPVDKNNVALSVKTSANVDCRYSQTLEDDFADMNTMVSSQKGNYWIHEKPLSLSEDKNYVYYVRCNYEPIALEKISFTLDRLKPKVNALDGGMFEIPEGWLDDLDLGIKCVDEPEYGFGCNETTYCITPLYDYSGDVGNCVPDTKYESLIDISYPVTICYYAQENFKNGMGGKYSDTTCQNFLVDDTNPILTVYDLPETVNENLLVVRGSIFDAVEQGALSFNDVTSDYDSIFEIFSGVKYFGAFSHTDLESNFDYSVTIDFSNINETADGEVRIWLEEGNDYVTLVFDLEENELKLGKKGLFGFSALDSVILDPDIFLGRALVRISKSGNTFIGEVQSSEGSDVYTLSGSDNLVPTKAGVIIKGQSLYDSLKDAFSNVFMLTQATSTTPSSDVFLKINSLLKSVESVEGDFRFETKFTEGVPYHGAQYEVLLYAKDHSGRQSEYISKTITYDLSGPEVLEITYDSEKQEDAGYVEYGDSAKMYVKIEDDYSETAKASVEFDDFKVYLDYNAKTGLWEGDLDTTELAIGMYDLKFEMYDKINNKNIQTIIDGMSIEDRIDPKFIITIPNPNFNDPTPEVLAETNITAICESEYEMDGQDYFASGNGILEMVHYFSINNPLPYTEGEETPHEIIVDCTSEAGDRIRQKFDIFMDFRKPIYTIQTQDTASYKTNVQRHYVEYTGLIPMEYGLYFLSDEPVMCKYSRSNEPGGSYSSLSNKFEKTGAGIYSEADLSDLYYFTDGSSETFSVICKDRAGNIGVTKKVEINVDSKSAPYMFDLPDTLSNTGKASFYSARALSCSYSGTSGSGSINRKRVSDYYYEYNMNIGLSSFSDGEYKYSITCNLDGKTTNKYLTIYKDDSPPKIVTTIPERVSDNELHVEINLDEEANIRIFVNGVLGDVYFGETYSNNLILDGGYNEVVIEAEDPAGNIAKSTRYVIVDSDVEQAYISNHLGSSTQDKFSGELVVNGLPTLIVNDELRPDLNLQKSENGFNYYSFDLTREELNGITDNVHKLEQASEIPIKFSVVVRDKVIHEEVMIYNYFAESVMFSSPYYRVVVNDDLINQNKLEISGKLGNENYILESIYSSSELELELSKFNFTTTAFDEQEIFFEFTNDLGVKTIISSKYILKRAGPRPKISLYPEGAITSKPDPKFLVVFEDLATITEAKIWDERLRNSYDVSGHGVIGWHNILNMVGKLPSEGQYYLNILAEDDKGVLGEGQFSFVYDEIEFDIDLVSPKNGVSSRNDYEVKFKTTVDALCRYSENSTNYAEMVEMSSKETKSHSLNLTGPKTINVKCQVNGEINSRVDTFVFTVDSTAPKINSAQVTNAKTISGSRYITDYPLVADILVNTDEAAYCRYSFGASGSNLKTTFNDMQDVGLNQCASLMNGNFCYSNSNNFIISNLKDGASYKTNIICQNKAGLESSLETIEFRVDFSKDDALIISYPKDYLNDNSVFIQAETKEEAPCKFGFESDKITNNFPHTDGRTHNATATLTTSGKHKLYVECIIEGNATQKTKSFVIDKTPPLVGKILVSNETNSLTFLQAVVQDFNDEESGIRSYEYSIGTVPSMRTGWNSERNWTTASGSTINAYGLNLVNGETYYFSVRASNKALLYSNIVSSTGTLVNTGSNNTGVLVDNNVTGAADSCNDGVRNGDETGVDCGEACLRPCPEGTFCETDSDCYSSSMECIDFECTYIDLNLNNDDGEDIEIDVDTGDRIDSSDEGSGWWVWLILILGVFAILGAGGYYAYERYGPVDWKFIHKGDSSSSKTQAKPSDGSSKASPSPTNKSPTMPADPSFNETAKVDNTESLKERKERLKKALRHRLVSEQREKSVAEREEMFDKFEGDDKGLGKKVSALKKSAKTKSHEDVKDLHKEVVGSSDTKKMLEEGKK